MPSYADRRVRFAGIARHDVCIDVHRIDRIGDRDFVPWAKDIENIPAIALRAIGDENFVVCYFQPARAVIILCDGAPEPVVALLGAVAMKSFPEWPGHPTSGASRRLRRAATVRSHRRCRTKNSCPPARRRHHIKPPIVVRELAEQLKQKPFKIIADLMESACLPTSTRRSRRRREADLRQIRLPIRGGKTRARRWPGPCAHQEGRTGRRGQARENSIRARRS